MTLSAGIILGGQQLDVMGAMDAGTRQAQNQLALMDQANMRNLFREQGDLIAAGDQNALAALAKLDPNASLGIQSNRLGMDAQKLGMDATRQDMQFSAEKMQMLREESKKEAAAALVAQADKVTAEQLAAESAALSEALSGGAFFYQNKDKAGYDAFLASKGLDPAEFPFEAFPAHAATVDGVLDAMEAFQPPTINPNDRFKVVGSTLMDLAAEGGPAAVAQGQIAEEIVMGPDGKPITIKGPAGTAAKFTEGQSKDNVFATRATGALEKLESPTETGTVADDLASLGGRVASNIPLVGNYMKSEGYQVAETAGQEFLQAILRKDTGAAITPAEEGLYGQTYLPQPGDGPQRLAYKREARTRAVEAIKAGMNAAQIEAIARADAAVVAQLAKDGSPAAEAPAPTKRLRYNPETGDFE